MSKRDYERLDIFRFGEHLLLSQDLDPIYTALVGCGWTEEKLNRWMLAYWVYYHAGVASFIAHHDEPRDYWNWMRIAAKNMDPTPDGSRWPRGHERRHMRGKNAEECVADLELRYADPSEFVDAVTSNTCGGVMRLVQQHRGFGPWIGFKVADMLERVKGYRVSFQQAEVFVFKDPLKAALMLWRREMGLPETARPNDKVKVLTAVIEHLTTKFAMLAAPPRCDRAVGLQEVETILCKWKSHLNGHYPLNNDITEITEGLQPWTHCSTARTFLNAMPGLTWPDSSL